MPLKMRSRFQQHAHTSKLVAVSIQNARLMVVTRVLSALGLVVSAGVLIEMEMKSRELDKLENPTAPCQVL